MNNETIFVTGFPGFLATRLVKRLAAEGARFILLIQPAYFTVARDVVQQMVRETEAPAENFRLVEGDITQPDLGLSADELARARPRRVVSGRPAWRSSARARALRSCRCAHSDIDRARRE